MPKPVWTTAQVDAFAPDAASIKAALKLNNRSKWPSLGQSTDALWGECKGSGAKPYQASIDISAELAFKCSCPSRKFPCKHSLALAYIFVAQPIALTAGQPPDWVADWLASRQQRSEKQAQKQTPAETDEAQDKRAGAQRQRQAQRDNNVEAGVAELQRWLEDSTRHGLAALADNDHDWQHMAQRMVDAQAPGLANWLLRCSQLRYQREHWQEELLRQLGKLYLLLNAW